MVLQPRENADPILESSGLNPRQYRLPVTEVENTHQRENIADKMFNRRLENNTVKNPNNQSNIPMLKLEIAMFNGKNHRW